MWSILTNRPLLISLSFSSLLQSLDLHGVGFPHNTFSQVVPNPSFLGYLFSHPQITILAPNFLASLRPTSTSPSWIQTHAQATTGIRKVLYKVLCFWITHALFWPINIDNQELTALDSTISADHQCEENICK